MLVGIRVRSMTREQIPFTFMAAWNEFHFCAVLWQRLLGLFRALRLYYAMPLQDSGEELIAYAPSLMCFSRFHRRSGGCLH